jgi:putative phosphotransacetylase
LNRKQQYPLRPVLREFHLGALLAGSTDISRISDEVARRVRERLAPLSVTDRIIVPVGISNRHLHVTREVVETLFGRGFQLGVLRHLTQPGEFASEQTVTIIGPKGVAIERVRILGPERSFTQVELARSDSIRLGLDLPVRRTGDLAGTPGLTVVGPVGTVILTEGAIRATRHIHMSEVDASRFGLSDGQVVKAQTAGPRAVTFGNVLVRASNRFALDFHLDTDDANAAGLETGSFVEILP